MAEGSSASWLWSFGAWGLCDSSSIRGLRWFGFGLFSLSVLRALGVMLFVFPSASRGLQVERKLPSQGVRGVLGGMSPITGTGPSLLPLLHASLLLSTACSAKAEVSSWRRWEL